MISCEHELIFNRLGAFIIGYGFLSVKIKQVWYLGEACKFGCNGPVLCYGYVYSLA
jgi:hypothetical protein